MDTTDGDDFADLLTIAAAQAEEEARQAKEELDAVDRTQIENTDDDFINDYDDDNSNSIAISKIKSSYMVLDDNDNAMSDAPTSPTTANAAMRQGAFEANSAPAPPAISEIKPFQPGSMPHGKCSLFYYKTPLPNNYSNLTLLTYQALAWLLHVILG